MCIDRTQDLACATLAINKAIIGIAELSLAEKAAKRHRYGAFRYSKAIQTYYAAYNIMASYMILTNQICKETKKDYDSVDPVKLNSEDESPETWEGQRKLEQDLSTLIGHSGIRKQCRKMRGWDPDELDPLEKLIWDTFVVPGSPLLYEKICYIRDRTIYRPSYVISTEGTPLQTSMYVRKEIDSLPNSHYLFAFMQRYLKAVLQQKDIDFLTLHIHLTECRVINSTEYLVSLGIGDKDIRKLKNNQLIREDNSMPSYICQLLELEPVNIVIKLYKAFWGPIIESIEKEGKLWR